ncbi:hypothetical protein MAR_005153 [Mya arenaria]|uniref:Uncharacterized protein n=1 Tax=Mya arenaria TaxID=6604 RepID=A0ABY7EYP0_MYAAR|nr:hypothetical protein MAR_005153 [Mya arenaria]
MEPGLTLLRVKEREKERDNALHISENRTCTTYQAEKYRAFDSASMFPCACVTVSLPINSSGTYTIQKTSAKSNTIDHDQFFRPTIMKITGSHSAVFSVLVKILLPSAIALRLVDIENRFLAVPVNKQPSLF